MKAISSAGVNVSDRCDPFGAPAAANRGVQIGYWIPPVVTPRHDVARTDVAAKPTLPILASSPPNFSMM
jgi:hypothetical protein